MLLGYGDDHCLSHHAILAPDHVVGEASRSLVTREDSIVLLCHPPESAGEVEGEAVGVAVGVAELSSCGSVTLCAENCWSSFQAPPSFTKPQTMTNLGVPVLSTKETSTVAVVPRASTTSNEWIVEFCIS